ncbi:MAG: T9SS type A sorting domain-containing protein [Bacteroidia bacterium]|nr:T9SS type A sorting domain-containing protein [Bacteroidia bacterium]
MKMFKIVSKLPYIKRTTLCLALSLHAFWCSSQTTPHWYTTNTSASYDHTILILSTVSVTGNIQIEPGDYLGAFYDSLGIQACGSGAGCCINFQGGTPWTGINLGIPVWEDSPLTPYKDGFTVGELLKWKLWRVLDNTEYHIHVTYDLTWPSDSLFVASGISKIWQIEAITSNNLELKAWVFPQTACDFSDTTHITVSIINDDTEPVANFPVSYSIDDGQTWVTDTVPTSILPGASMIYTFNQTVVMSPLQDYHCIATVNLNGDINTGNDTVYFDIYGLNLGDSIATEHPDTVVLSAGNHFDSYNWSDGSSGQDLHVTGYGSYSVTLTYDSCVLVDQVVVYHPLSVGHQMISEISLYPDPASETLNIRGIDDPEISIFSITGRQLITEKGNHINISSLPQGIYFCRIININYKLLIIR